MDAGAIMQNDTSLDNLRVMTETTREFGVYSQTPSSASVEPAAPAAGYGGQGVGLAGRPAPRIKPGVCIPWEEKAKALPPLTGDPDLVKTIWENVEGLGNTFIWQCLLSF
jgi:hypothetical protein